LCGLIALAWVQAKGADGQATATPKPAAPRSFEAIAVSPTEIRCYWLPAAGATGYTVQRDGETLATLPPPAQEYHDTGLPPNSTHRYTVTAEFEGNAPAVTPPYIERTFAPFPTDPESRRGKRGETNPKSKIQNPKFDVVIIQASSGGVSAAIEAARRGLKVALVESTTRLGGMPVNGLSATDLRRPEHASGFLARFRDRVKQLYAAEGIKGTGLEYEPRVAHQAIKSLLWEQPGITVLRRARLAWVLTRDTAPEGARRRVEAVVIEELNADGQPTGRRAILHAKVFVDATDCGDLAAWAGAPFWLGREPRSAKEPHNGVIYYNRSTGKSLPGSTGRGDRRIQAYSYLLTVKDYGKGADKTIPRPPGYRKEDFTHTPDWKDSWAVTSGSMPGSKHELNQHPEGGDLQEINYGYPTDDYKARERVDRLYRNRVLGYLYYIQTEQGQPQVGLPDDEYRDSGGFPPLLYVREGRRILGEELPVEADITRARSIVRPESVGIGDYPMDSHAVRPKTNWTTPDMGEGEWWLYQITPWHELPLGVMIPRRLDNVFVTTAVSSTHVSFGTYRLEAVRMAFGQAAGIAAGLCIRYGLTAREVPARQMQDELLPHAANPYGDPNVYLYYLSDVKPDHPHDRAIQYLSARGFQFTAEELKPDAPTTREQLANWLEQLVARAAPAPRILAHLHNDDGSPYTVVQRPFYAYMGPAADREAVRALRREPNPTAPATRAEIAHWLIRALRWQPSAANRPPNADRRSDRYSDVPDTLHAEVTILDDHCIDSLLWDGLDALRPNKKLAFRPDSPLSHAALFETLYIAQLGLGPLFFDSPVDGRNGRAVPSALYETVVVPSP
jgi:hypothetical protein